MGSPETSAKIEFVKLDQSGWMRGVAGLPEGGGGCRESKSKILL